GPAGLWPRSSSPSRLRLRSCASVLDARVASLPQRAGKGDELVRRERFRAPVQGDPGFVRHTLEIPEIHLILLRGAQDLLELLAAPAERGARERAQVRLLLGGEPWRPV